MGAPAASNSSVITFFAPGGNRFNPVSRIKKGKVYCLIIPLVVWHVISINFWDAEEKKQWKGWKKTLLLCWDFTELLHRGQGFYIADGAIYVWNHRYKIGDIVDLLLIQGWLQTLHYESWRLSFSKLPWSMVWFNGQVAGKHVFFLIFPHESWVVKIPPCSSMSVSTSQSWRPSWCGRRPLQKKTGTRMVP